MKKFFIIAVVAAAIGGGAFFFYKKKSATNNEANMSAQMQQDMQAQRAKMAEQQKAFFVENFTEINKDELVVGDAVTVMGTTNTDGSVVAANVILGDEEQLAAMMSKMRTNMSQPNIGDGSNTVGSDANNTRQFTAQMSQAQQQRGADFQNMTDDERAQMRAQWSSANGGSSGGRQRAGGQKAGGGAREGGQARISGEVLSKDDTGITLKLSTGGSKLIFFSSDTQILKFK